MLDLVDRVDDLALGVREADGVLEAPRDADEHELVDGGGDDEAAVLARVAREVGAAAAEREAHGCARDDHGEGSRSKVPIELGQPFRRADLEKPLMRHAGPQALPRGEVALDASSPRGSPGGSAAMTSRRSAVAP